MTGLLGGLAVVPPYINIMQALAWVMIALYGHMFFSPGSACAARWRPGRWPTPAAP